MLRRTLVLGGVGVAMAGVPRAWAATPDATATADRALQQARVWFDAGGHRQVLAALPSLLAVAEAAGTDAHPRGLERLAAVHDLAVGATTKTGDHEAGLCHARAARAWANRSESPLAVAAAMRSHSVVLRHQGQEAAAQRLTIDAAAVVEASGLNTAAQRAAFAQMAVTAAYSSAVAGDRGTALELIDEASRAVAGLPPAGSPDPRFPVGQAGVRLYRASVMWALGEPGRAWELVQSLSPAQFATAERRARLYTDGARAAFDLGRFEETATCLLLALRASPDEVRDRSSIRSIADMLIERHPLTPGVRDLTAALHT